MNNLKKLGVSALAGSLAAFSAQAAELSFTGDSSVSYTSGQASANASAASGISADVGMSFSASGEMDNGWTATGSLLLTESATLSSSWTSLTMGSMGTISTGSGTGVSSTKYD